METDPILRQIAEVVLKKITDIREVYIEKYELTPTNWDNSLRNLYFLNCDVEIINFLKKLEIDINESALDFGLTYGILILKNQIMNNYNNKYGNDMDQISLKANMYDDINDVTIDFIVHGV